MPTLELRAVATGHVGPLDLRIGAGECVSLRGASGSGKSLLLRALADLDPHAGEVWLDGVACSAMPAPQWRRKVVLVAAESQWWHARVGAHFPPGFERARLAALDLPGEALDWEVTRCSTGERQRLALLRALALQPAALLLDEPTAHLDADSSARVEALVADYRRDRAAAVLWVSHDARQAARVASRRLVLREGRLEADTDTAEDAWVP